MSPPSSSGRPPDVAAAGWAGITVRVAWTLLVHGVRVRPPVLRDARDHVLFHLDPNLPIPQAEDRAAWLTRAFVSRARRRPLDDPWPMDGLLPLSPRWRRALERSLSPLSEAVFRHHFADRRPLEQLERVLQVDRIALEAARGGLREVVRRVAVADGVPLDQWPNERLDRLIARLAEFSTGPCPALVEVLDGHHREHAHACCRCDRASRLIRGGALTIEDLLPPRAGARPTHVVEVLALHFHPDGRAHRDALAAETGVATVPRGEDVLLLDAAQADDVRRVLVVAAEVGTPRRDHVRGAIVSGPGRWSPHGLLGPTAERAIEEVRTRPWGRVDGIGELPAPLPAPPSARRWWTAVAVAGALCVATAANALHPAPPDVDHPLDARFTAGRGGVWVDLDLPDAALLTLVREVDGRLDLLLVSAGISDKSALAVGDGRYRVHAMGSGALVVSSSVPLIGIDRMLEEASLAEEPLEDLARRLRTAHPRADVQLYRR